ncbi:1d31a824-5929-44b4-9706-879e0a161818 [Sclerotinia trifoliorum]|uniref:1d31a824-5929-44b4-9706-879e0a161818 n=1 Tax=Sclerotinia trifoliorum TaxID=28548 RepID=A0A8H2VWP6_9HELO|nr:1d31a824-5929-44b4-9706-879e0a161818 [Sclerotinia trifoliorum]
MVDIYSAPIPSPTFFEDSLPVESPTIFKKPLLPRLKMTTMGEPAFGGSHNVSHSAGHSSNRASDIPWTPYSAVSSFNLPAHYGSSLITPITMAPSPDISSRPSPTVRERNIKLSPSMESPGYPLFGGDEDDFGSRFDTAPMKQKQPSSNNSKIPTSESNYPIPPGLLHLNPHFGAYGVSATPKSGRSAELKSPDMNTSPRNTSSSAMSADLQKSRHATPDQSPGSYKVNNSAPILIAPNPNTMRPATRPGEMPYRDGLPYGRHDSMNSMHSISTSMNSYHSTSHHQLEQQVAPLPTRRKRKSSPTQLDEEIIYSVPINHEEQVLMQLSDVDGLPWKEIAKEFNARTGKSMKVPALQMRKKRLCERLRIWTNCEERALTLAWEDYDRAKWEEIAKGMMRHGVQEKWSKEAVQRKFNEMFPPDERSCAPSDYALCRHAEDMHYEVKMEPRTPWPNHDEGGSEIHSLTDEEQTLVDELRSRTASDASSLHFQQHQHQEIMYAQQHQQNHQEVWAGN